jgi:secreted trypsin-like serine protease
VAGFGKDAFGNGKHSFIMKEVDVPVVDPNTCENLLRATRLGKYFELNKHSFMCAGGEDGKDSCTGDGGSPLVCETNGVWHVVGLVAWGIGK